MVSWRYASAFCNKFIAPLGGLPSRVPQILIDLVCVFVCLSVASLRDFYRMVSASVTHAIVFGLFKQGPKRGPAFQTFKDEIRSFPGPKNLRLFFRKSLKKKQ